MACYTLSNRHYHPTRGFTLLELSIVLVIVALLAATVLAGQTMIESLKYRRIASEAQEIKTAMSVFQTRFGYYAGDIRDFSLLANGAAQCTPVAGNQDGRVGGTVDYWTESAQALCQLGNEGLISPQTSGTSWGWMSPSGAFIPSKAYGATRAWGLNYKTLGYYVNYVPPLWLPYDATDASFAIHLIGGPDANPCGPCAAGALTAHEAFMLDRKTDDGLPRDGQIRAVPKTTCSTPTDCATPCMPWAYNVTAYQNVGNNVEKNCILTFLPDL